MIDLLHSVRLQFITVHGVRLVKENEESTTLTETGFWTLDRSNQSKYSVNGVAAYMTQNRECHTVPMADGY